jgi:hypothetical protein
MGGGDGHKPRATSHEPRVRGRELRAGLRPAVPGFPAPPAGGGSREPRAESRRVAPGAAFARAAALPAAPALAHELAAATGGRAALVLVLAGLPIYIPPTLFTARSCCRALPCQLSTTCFA